MDRAGAAGSFVTVNCVRQISGPDRETDRRRLPPLEGGNQGQVRIGASRNSDAGAGPPFGIHDQASIRLSPMGCGTGSPCSRGVSIQSCIASLAQLRAASWPNSAEAARATSDVRERALALLPLNIWDLHTKLPKTLIHNKYRSKMPPLSINYKGYNQPPAGSAPCGRLAERFIAPD